MLVKNEGWLPSSEMLARVTRFEGRGLVVKPFVARAFTISYGEILTAERLRAGRGIRLHTRTTDPVLLVLGRGRLTESEALLRAHGVRVVDCWGSLITPTLADFEDALARGPAPVRQSSDNA